MANELLEFEDGTLGVALNLDVRDIGVVVLGDFAGIEVTEEERRTLTDTGPGLGSMLTVSGAAVSPNWGYHSSRITAFLMTLFNARLGAWLPNPAYDGNATRLQRSSPCKSWARSGSSSPA